MMAWLVMGTALVLLAAALVLAARMWRDRNRWRSRCAEAEADAREARGHVDEQQGALALAAAAAAVGRQLRAPLGLLRDQRRAADDLFRHYHQLINHYDDAVRYCLQPVDLLPGADEFTLERLVRHVSDARRRLFAARQALLDSRLPQLLSERLARGDEAVDQVGHLAGALCRFDSSMEQDDGEIDVNELLSAALALTQTRLPPSVRVIRRLEAVPALPRVPWLAPALLQLLQMAADGAGGNGRLIARTRLVKRHIEVHVIGHAALASADAMERRSAQVQQAVQALHGRLGPFGASVETMPFSGQGQGMVLCLPVRAEAIAA
ncbi:MAG TPA: hypothetical protein VFG73_07640 [Rhodanobacteraceae bacterium]|nr:hypothetical protein [Rhodanobacteraceae bacterium]